MKAKDIPNGQVFAAQSRIWVTNPTPIKAIYVRFDNPDMEWYGEMRKKIRIFQLSPFEGGAGSWTDMPNMEFRDVEFLTLSQDGEEGAPTT